MLYPACWFLIGAKLKSSFFLILRPQTLSNERLSWPGVDFSIKYFVRQSLKYIYENLAGDCLYFKIYYVYY